MKNVMLFTALTCLCILLTISIAYGIEKKKACLKTIYEPEYDWDQYKVSNLIIINKLIKNTT